MQCASVLLLLLMLLVLGTQPISSFSSSSSSSSSILPVFFFISFQLPPIHPICIVCITIKSNARSQSCKLNTKFGQPLRFYHLFVLSIQKLWTFQLSCRVGALSISLSLSLFLPFTLSVCLWLHCGRAFYILSICGRSKRNETKTSREREKKHTQHNKQTKSRVDNGCRILQEYSAECSVINYNTHKQHNHTLLTWAKVKARQTVQNK